MNITLLKACLVSLIFIQAACADDTAKSATESAVVDTPATGISTSTSDAETAVLKTNTDASKPADDAAMLAALREKIADQLPGMPVDSIVGTPVEGVYELITEGQIYYVNSDASFLLTGNMIELATQQNLTELRLGGLHMDLLASIDESNMLIYEPEKPADRSITVFTDISCGYCRLLHEQIDTLLDAGVRVRYMLFPRAGLESPGHQALESVWCNSDPQEAMTTAKAGGQVAEASCANPIESHVQIAEQVGLRGTPLIYLDTGERVHGYREAAILAEMVNAGEPYRSPTAAAK
jgi:thiol:disulfide interchange protein DsbC